MDLKETRELLSGFTITGCAIRSEGEMALVAQDWSYDDPMEPHETRIFIYKPNRSPDEQWGSAGLGTCREMLVSPLYTNDERWLFVSSTGDLFIVDDNAADFDSPIEGGVGYIWGVQLISKSRPYFVGPHRKVIQRNKKNVTTRVHSASLDNMDLVQKQGFCDLDGFAENDIYACGGLGDLWHYDGTNWHFIDLTTNASFYKICCGADGKVYVLADARFLFVGRNDVWAEIKFDEFEGLIGDMQWYKDRLMIVTERACYELINNMVVPSQIIEDCPLKEYAYLACYQETIFLANTVESAFFDGSKWAKVL